MINIDELRQRVEAAEQRFGMVDSSQRQSSEKLIGMMNAIEQDQAQKQIALEESKALVASMAIENQQLRSMLHSLLLATEAAGNVQSVEIMRQIGEKLTAIVDAAAPVVAEAVETPEASEASEASEAVEASEVSEALEPIETEAPMAAESVETVEAAEVVVAAEPDVEVMPAEEPAAVLGSAPADVPFDDDVLPEPPGVLPTAVADPVADPVADHVVAPIVAEESAPAVEASNGEATSGETSNGAAGGSKVDAVEAANGVREILLRMNKEKRQQEAAARPQS